MARPSAQLLRPPAVLRGLGWQWTAEGPIVSVRLDGRRFRVLVPIHDVHAIFEDQAAAVGCPCIGAPVTVAGLFDRFRHAQGVARVPSMFGGAAADQGRFGWGNPHPTSYQLEQRGQMMREQVAKGTEQGLLAAIRAQYTGKVNAENYTATLTQLMQKYPTLRMGLSMLLVQLLSPADIQTLKDRGVLNSSRRGGGMFGTLARGFSSAVKGVAKLGSMVAKGIVKPITNNPLWDIVATGVSFVPGIGQAVSAGMAAAAAVGRGESLRDIGIAAAKNALPGGPLAAAAFDIAVGVAKGQRLDQAAISAARNQLPGGPVALAAFDAGIAAANGKSPKQIAQAAGGTLASHALPALAPSLPALKVARGLHNTVQDGVRAASQIKQGIRTSRTLAGLQGGFMARQAMAGIVKRAQQGHPMARQVVGAFQGLPPARRPVPSPFTFRSVYRQAFA